MLNDHQAPDKPWKKLADLEQAIIQHIPPIEAPTCHWLESDAGPSYCWDHVRQARWKQLPSFGPCPDEPKWPDMTDMEELIRSGIGGDAYIGSECDTSEYCSTCGRTLDHLLTYDAVCEKLAEFRDSPIEDTDQINGEFTYMLTRIFMNLENPAADQIDIALALKVAEDTLSAINAQKATVDPSEPEFKP